MIAIIAALYGVILTLVVQALRAEYRPRPVGEDVLRTADAPTQTIQAMWAPDISPMDMLLAYTTVEDRPDGLHLVWRTP